MWLVVPGAFGPAYRPHRPRRFCWVGQRSAYSIAPPGRCGAVPYAGAILYPGWSTSTGRVSVKSKFMKL